MIKLSAIAAAFAVSTIAAMPASAADLKVSDRVDVVRIRLEGKSDAQITTEVRDAARTVCRHSETFDCVHVTFMDATYRLDSMRHAQILASAARRQVASN